MISLNNFKMVCRTDKYDDWCTSGPGQGHNYVGMFYDEICAPMKDTATAILEIGIAGGQSHLLWSCYFQNANIYGCDIASPPYPDHNRIRLLCGTNAYQPGLVDVFRNVEPRGYDMIVDDGPHTLETQQFFINHFFQLVKPGGFMVIEDVIGDESLEILMHDALQLGAVKSYYSPASTLGVNDINAIVIKKP